MKLDPRQIFIKFLTLTGIGLVVMWFLCRDCFFSPSQNLGTIAITFLLTFGLYLGNGWLSYFLGKKIDWVKAPVKRAVIGIVSSVLLSTALVVVTYYFVFIYRTENGWETYRSSMQWTVMLSLVITLVISLLLHAREFLFHWREAALRIERLKREQLHSSFASLKSQLNPHFLFNSLNALTALVYRDPDQAAAFIKKLSDTYRYILEHAEEEVIELEKEVACLKSYIYLLNIRHGDPLVVSLDLPEIKAYVPPLSLQMLLENASKHNIISKKMPLKVEIFVEGNKVVVQNDYQPREDEIHSTGKGLSNIKARYQLLTDEKVEIIMGDGKFVVKLPLLFFDDKEKLPSALDNLPISDNI